MSTEAAEALNQLTRAYLWNGDLIQCRKCKRGQQVTWREWDFPHASGCKNDGAEPRPWLLFCEMVNAARIQPREQVA
jgi:hypothetical protein